MNDAFIFRQPTLQDGMAVYQLIQDCPPLDTNSSYCNLLQCSHFAATSIAAFDAHQHLVGFISGYTLADSPNTLFIWQVAVTRQARGKSLAKQMLNHLIERITPQFIHTTITDDNQPSWGLFRAIAHQHNVPLADKPYFDSQQHFAGAHPSEQLVILGPFQAA
ncbi:diaminobutyrate acetyltransferase [Celerinatantimonas yamalensis]|uniref:L-2,4-diaminobutyric acid acetyltransferase n=1 Tax=Celerinatantimonas yamalensis TaxID=559956 RepID=A0ABW9G569_9GAMM